MRHLKAVNDKAKRIEHLVEVAEAARRGGEGGPLPGILHAPYLALAGARRS